MKKKQIKLILLGLCLLSINITAQTNPAEVEEVLRVESRLVVVPVAVVDKNGQPISGLTKTDFKVSEEGHNQEIEKLGAAEDIPLEIAVLIDISASTDPMFKFEQETAAAFLRDVMRPNDRASIFAIGEKPFLLQERTDGATAAETLKVIIPTKQFTAFYDSVRAAADYLRTNAPTGTRRVLIVISDGEDTNSESIRDGFNQVLDELDKSPQLTKEQRYNRLVQKREELRANEQHKTIKALQDADCVMYSVNPAGGSYQLNKISQFGQSNLDKFSSATGGSAYLPKFKPVDLRDPMQNSQNAKQNSTMISDIFKVLANEIRAQYLIQYYSDQEFPKDKFVALRVTLNRGNDARVRARQGYFVK